MKATGNREVEKSLKEAAKTVFEQEVSRNETLENCGAWAVVIGLAIEFGSAILLHNADTLKAQIDKWLVVSATALIAIGVYFEIHFGKNARAATDKLRYLSEEKVAELQLVAAEANARAAEANAKSAEAKLQLETFRSPRLPSAEELELMTEKLKPFAGTQFDTGLSSSSGEQADFLWKIEPAIVAAGWKHIDWANAGLYITQGNRPLSGTVAATNVEIHVYPSHRGTLQPAANELVSVLMAIGIEARDVGFNAHSKNNEAIHILIGDKR